MTRLAAVVASTVATSSGQAESWAIGLDVSKPLAVVALLRFGGARKRALVRLVSCPKTVRYRTLLQNTTCYQRPTRLFAVVAKALSGGAHLGVVANVATFVACSAR